MKGSIGITDNDWFEFLSQQPGIDEVNFCKLKGYEQGLFILMNLHSGNAF
jgi:hypothetical protein